MFAHIRPAIVLAAAFIALTGLAYPLAITCIAQIAFPAQANGSLIRNGETVIGSSLIGQHFASDRYFWPRPSATAEAPYNAGASAGSNLGPTSANLAARVKGDVARLVAAGIAGPVPADGATASGSGLDPDISPEFALAQVGRVAAARGLPEADVAALIDRFTDRRLLGIVGEPRINVLRLNMALDTTKS
ncbi:potassium-transporting ATPase subunit KdpC [Mesorhizobium marinum]|uniref:potassium-transporting ATPase subunit KdpC n=1 Tax=Mesorhizobium marinum TaxID=3228790 RepID=UPI003464ED87